MTEHSFNTELAKQYGIECAIVIKNLDFWLSKNKANNKNYHDDRYWTYMSMSGFSEYFDYLTENQVRYILKKLEDNEVIETGNYNKKGYDRTKWYTFTNSFVKNNSSILQYSHIHLGKLPDAFEKINEPIPYTKTDIKTDTNSDINIYTAHQEITFEFFKQFAKKTTHTRIPSEKEHLLSKKLLEQWNDKDLLISLIPIFFDDTYKFWFNKDKAYYYKSFCSNIETLLSAKKGNYKNKPIDKPKNSDYDVEDMPDMQELFAGNERFL